MFQNHAVFDSQVSAYLQLFQGCDLAISFYHGIHIGNYGSNDLFLPCRIRRNKNSTRNTLYQVILNLQYVMKLPINARVNIKAIMVIL